VPSPPTPSTPSPQPTPDPVLLNCSNLSSGVSYPHPSDRASFIICRNGSKYDIFTCPRPSIFDAKFRICINNIELPSPHSFDCSNLTQGSYPHPSDCSSFFICLDGELAGEFTCPPSQSFDPIQQTCKFTEQVLCFFTCKGRRGVLPHSTDCSKYINCRCGSPTIEVFNCPEPLLFDPVLLKCNLPQLTKCSSALPC
jgi:hypothetical protein